MFNTPTWFKSAPEPEVLAAPLVDEPRKPAVDRATTAGVPIRSIGPAQRERIAAHLLGLEPQDRYLRFGYAANDRPAPPRAAANASREDASWILPMSERPSGT